jgi:hypothetical protein
MIVDWNGFLIVTVIPLICGVFAKRGKLRKVWGICVGVACVFAAFSTENQIQSAISHSQQHLQQMLRSDSLGSPTPLSAQDIWFAQLSGWQYWFFLAFVVIVTAADVSFTYSVPLFFRWLFIWRRE